MAPSNKGTVVSLFSGAGGFDWGFHNAGYKTQLAVEILPQAAKTLAKNLGLDVKDISENKESLVLQPDDLPVVVQGDVRKVDFSKLSGTQVDVLIGGPPCQDFSMTKGNKREGEHGKRGKLYQHFLRALMFIQPKVFIFENVPGFISANDGNAYKTVLSDVANLDHFRCNPPIESEFGFAVPTGKINGYRIMFNDIIDAPDFGVPQTRRRLIIIGIRADLATDVELKLPAAELAKVMSGDCWQFKKFPLTCLEIFEGKPLTKLDDVYKKLMQGYEDLATDKSNWAGARTWKANVWSKLTFDVVKDYYMANGLNYAFHDQVVFDEAMRQHEDILRQLGWLNKPVYELDMTDGTHRQIRQSVPVADRMEHIPPGENASFVNDTEWTVVHKDISFIYRRALPLKPAWTVMAYGGGGTYGYHYERSRSILTLRERARIQTFSDEFAFQGVDIRAQIGEAVPPLLAQRIAEAVGEVLSAIEALPEKSVDYSYQLPLGKSVQAMLLVE